MIDRRQFNLAALALGAATTAAPLIARAQPRRVFRLANSATVNDAQQCFITCGQSPRLGYYAAEGVDVEYVNMSNTAQSMQTIVTGETNFGTVSPIIFFGQAAKEPELGVIAVYNFLPGSAASLCVKPDSPYKSVLDLKDKRIGIRNQGDTGPIALRLMFKELGVADPGIAIIPIGDGGPAGKALYDDRVDAIISFDTATARVELAGFPLRYLPLTPKVGGISSAWFGVSKKDLTENRKQYVGLFRAMAKSTLFARANLDQAINLHWARYPESKPKSKTEDEGRQEFKTILARRKDNWVRKDDDPEKRHGYITPSDAEANLVLASEITKDPGLAAKLGDLGKWYSNDLIEEVNAFDKAAIIKQAREFKA